MIDHLAARSCDEWVSGGWRRAIALLDDTANPPLVVPYYRVDEARSKPAPQRRLPPLRRTRTACLPL